MALPEQKISSSSEPKISLAIFHQKESHPTMSEREKVLTPADICTFCPGVLDPSDLVYDVSTCRIVVWCKSCKRAVPFGKLEKKFPFVQPPIVKLAFPIKREKFTSTPKRPSTHSFPSSSISMPEEKVPVRKSVRRELMHQCSLCSQTFAKRFDWIVHVKTHFVKKEVKNQGKCDGRL